MSALADNKAVSRQFKTAATPVVLDDVAWQAELDKNTSWITYHRAVMDIIQNGDPRAGEQRRGAAIFKVIDFIEKNNTPEAAAKLGEQAFAYAICEAKGSLERYAFDLEFAQAALNLGPSKKARADLEYDVEVASEKTAQFMGECNLLQAAQKHVSAEDFGVALMARLLARASNTGFKAEAETLRGKLDANFDVAEAVGNTLRSGVGDYFNFSVMTEDGKPKPQAFLVLPKPGTQYIN
ncbi:MAG: hypothetical protein ACAH80_16000 [Alphaproteobacteria bacterium]